MRRSSLPAVVAAAVTVTVAAYGCSGTNSARVATPAATPTPNAATAEAAVRAQLARPLMLPQITGECPVSPGVKFSDEFGVAQGRGPVYWIGDESDVLYGHSGDFAGSAWGGQKVLWVGRSDYQGPVLIRGHQLDGPHELRFGDGVLPSDSLFLPADSGGGGAFRNWPSYTRFISDGCYGYQVDGLDFSYVITAFRAREDKTNTR